MTTTTSSSSSSSSFLTFIIDLNPHAWAFPSSSSSSIESSPLSSLLPVLLIFLNSHLALAYGNGVAVYVCSTQGRARLIYSTASHSSLSGRQAKGKDRSRNGGDSGTDASTYQHFGNLNRAVLKGVQDMVDEMGDDFDEDEQEEDEEPETALVKAFSMALNHLNRIAPPGNTATSVTSTSALPPSRNTDLSSNTPLSSSTSPNTNARILLLSLTASASNQYIGLMNCIFAAQRRSIPIDVLKIAGEDTVFLQQATNLTGGIYFRLSGPIREGEASEEDQDQPPAPEQLLQLLLSTYLPPPHLRRMLNLPTLDEVDFRASCFCHGAIVDVGYVCGVCLSIFCHPPTKCHICSSPFPKKTLRRFEADLTAPRGNPPVVEDQQPNGDRTNGVGLVEGVPSVAMQVDD